MTWPLKPLLACLATLLLGMTLGACAPRETVATATPRADTLALRASVAALADPALAGRRSGEPGNAAARRWLRARLPRLGLEPVLAEGFEQPFAIAGRELSGLGAKLSDGGELEIPLLLSLNRPAPELAAVDLALWHEDEPAPRVKGPALLVRRGPASARGHFSPSTLQREAAAAGAVGLILVPHSADSAGVYKRYFGRARQRDPRLYALDGDAPAPILAYAHSESAAALIAAAAKQPGGWSIDLPAAQSVAIEGRNLLARIPGAPAGAPVVLLVAHYDHLGVGPDGVYPGADDNASSVAVLLETARLLSGRRPDLEIRFLFSDAEELGLLGAEYYARTQPAPDLVINLDSVGRAAVDSYRKLRDPAALDPWLLIHWRSEASGEAGLDAQLGAAGFNLQAGAGPMFERGGDHWAFAERGLPAHFLFGGFHGDYNTVNDVAERIEIPRLSRLAESLAATLRAGAGLGGPER